MEEYWYFNDKDGDSMVGILILEVINGQVRRSNWVGNLDSNCSYEPFNPYTQLGDIKIKIDSKLGKMALSADSITRQMALDLIINKYGE